jgi:hypothetical protein
VWHGRSDAKTTDSANIETTESRIFSIDWTGDHRSDAFS